MTSLSLFHCSSSVSLLPISQEAKPHCGLRQRRSSEIYFSASWMRAITKHFPTLTVRLCLTTRRIIVDCQIAYENGARVETSFVTSYSGGIVAQTSPDLTKAINRENDRLIKANTKELPKYDYPMNVITAAMMQRYARYGGRPENSGRWLHPGWKPGRTKAGRKRYFWVRSAFVRARSGSQMGTFGPRESHHTAAWLVPCGGRRHQQNAPGELRANKEHINAQKRAAYAARKVSTNEENTATIKVKTSSSRQFVSEQLFQKHYDKHLSEFGEISKERYLEKANALADAPLSEDIVQLVRSDGSIAKYCYSTNEFVVVTADGNIRTYFKPETKEAYWDEEIDRNK